MAKQRQFASSGKNSEKSHQPVIDCPEKVEANQPFMVKVTLGGSKGHPDTPRHHINRISLYYSDDNAQIIRQIAGVDFTGHSSNEDNACSNYETIANVRIPQSGLLHAMAYCSVHGLVESVKEITVI